MGIKAKSMVAAMLSAVLVCTVFAGCQGDTAQQEAPSRMPEIVEDDSPENQPAPPEKEPDGSDDVPAAGAQVRVGALIGPTGMGMVGLMDAAEQGETANEYTFTLASSPDEIAPKLISGELDIAAVPANLASVLYNRTQGGVRVLAVNTLGVLYVVAGEGEEVRSMEDLDGRTVYATGQGATPEYTLRYLLEKNGVDAQVEFKSEHAELAALLLAGEATLAVLPEPFVTNVANKSEALQVALNLTEEWEKSTGGAQLPTGSIVVRSAFLEENPQAVEAFLGEYRDSTRFVNEEVEAAAALIGKYEIAEEEIAKQAIPRCNIVFVDGEPMKTALETYYQILFEAEEDSIGGALPDEDFYYSKS